jgi:uncharacterized protein (DUF58 family)
MRRKLEVTLAGKWYIALTIGLGVAAILSGNNVLYLIESILLSGMILSGVLSERAISAVEVRAMRAPIAACTESADTISLSNHSKQTLFCIEILEWNGKKFDSLSFVPRIGPNASIKVSSDQKLKSRGVHSWSGFAVATSFPFGFARKLRLIDGPGERLVWPKRDGQLHAKAQEALKRERVSTAGDFSEGEVRAASQDDDPRTIIWTMSGRGTEDYARVRKKESASAQVLLDRREAQSDEEFETRVLETAAHFYLRSDLDQEKVLLVRDGQGTQRFRGKKASLNVLATVKRERA